MNWPFAYALLVATTMIASGNWPNAVAGDLAAGKNQGPAPDLKTNGIVYSDWAGGCTVGPRADFLCAMRREARSSTGEQLGLISFGQGEQSRYLFVEIFSSSANAETLLNMRIDNHSLANGEMTCVASNWFCSMSIKVDNNLLKRLTTGTVLSIETRQGDIKLQFPLYGFTRARLDFL